MTDDQEFIVAMVTLIVPTVASVLAYLKTRETHGALNGALKKGSPRRRRHAAVDSPVPAHLEVVADPPPSE